MGKTVAKLNSKEYKKYEIQFVIHAYLYYIPFFPFLEYFL